MASLLRSVHFQPPPPSSSIHKKPLFTSSSSSLHCVHFRNQMYSKNCYLFSNFTPKLSYKFPVLASSNEATDTQSDAEQTQQPELQQDNAVEDPSVETEEEALSADDESEVATSLVITALQLYRKALSDNDESKIAELEQFFKSIEEEKSGLEIKVASLLEDLSVERERVLRISADFDNFRKRTERERLSLVTNAQGEVIENFLPVLDNFERAKSQIKIGSEAEEKINNSYQSIYKQFIEILGSIGVVLVETVGKPFDPLLHEAIMREDSTKYDEGVIIEEFRKGFQLGDRLLRPSMVKVSAGPGPEKSETTEPAVDQDDAAETGEDAGGIGDGNEQATP